MRVYVEGIGLIGPGLPGWQASAPMLSGRVPYVFEPLVVAPSKLLPPAERRRAGLPIKLGMAVGEEAFAHAGRDAGVTATVFTSSSGDGENVHSICEALATPERLISPTRFHNSVHNAPAGYWSIATHSREASTSIACHDASFTAGFLDAAAQVVVENAAVALISHDQPYMEPLNALPVNTRWRHSTSSSSAAPAIPPAWTTPRLKNSAPTCPQRAACRCSPRWHEEKRRRWRSITSIPTTCASC
jgi:hypothetical protein